MSYTNACHRKIPRTKKEAIQKADEYGDIVVPYRCRFCFYWHVGRNKGESKLFRKHRHIWLRRNL